MGIGAACVYPEVSGGHRDMLHVSLLGESSITDDGTGTVRTRSSRAVVLVAFLVGHAGSPQSRQRIAEFFGRGASCLRSRRDTGSSS